MDSFVFGSSSKLRPMLQMYMFHCISTVHEGIITVSIIMKSFNLIVYNRHKATQLYQYVNSEQNQIYNLFAHSLSLSLAPSQFIPFTCCAN